MDPFYHSMPKAELHAHLTGSLSVATIEKLISLRQRTDPSYLGPTNAQKLLIAQQETKTLDEVFRMFPIIQQLLLTPEAVTLATEDVIREFAQENVCYLELRSTPKTVTAENGSVLMTKSDYIQAILKAMENVSTELQSICVRVILSIDRRQTVEQAQDTLDLALRFKAANEQKCPIVGIELSGDPRFDGRKFIPVFDRARNEGLKVSLHILESTDCSEEVTSLLNFGPDRIGHATLAHTQKAWADSIERAKVPLEVCPTSNVVSQTVLSYADSHLEFWLSKNHPVCICTDDKGLFGTTLTREFEIVAKTFNLNKQQTFALSLNGFKHAFAAEEEMLATCKSQLLDFASTHNLKCEF